MQKLSAAVDYYKTICSAIDATTAALNEHDEPFIILSLVYKKNVPYDIVVLGFNKSFHTLINKELVILQSVRRSNPKLVKYWLDALVVVSATGGSIPIKNYTSFGEGRTFEKVTAFHIKLLGRSAIGLVFENPKEISVHDMCLSCPNNPTVSKPTLKMKKLDFVGMDSSCELCRLAQSLSAPNGV